jgi:hypothetical protein
VWKSAHVVEQEFDNRDEEDFYDARGNKPYTLRQVW